MRRALLPVLGLLSVQALASDRASSSPPGFTILRLCSDWYQVFRVEVSRGGEVPLRAGACAELRVVPGPHLLVPRPFLFSYDYLAHPAWVVHVGKEGATVRFGPRGVLLDIVSVEGTTALEGIAPSHVPARGEVEFHTSALGALGFYPCWAPIAMIDVLSERISPLFVSRTYFSTFVTAVGLGGPVGLYDLSGDPVCVPTPRMGEPSPRRWWRWLPGAPVPEGLGRPGIYALSRPAVHALSRPLRPVRAQLEAARLRSPAWRPARAVRWGSTTRPTRPRGPWLGR